MNRLTLRMLVLPCVFGVVSATANVKELKTQQDLQNALKENKDLAIKVYADWCGACKAAAKPFHNAVKQHEGEIAAYNMNVDNDEFKAWVRAFKITGLPTVLYLHITETTSPEFTKWLDKLVENKEKHETWTTVPLSVKYDVKVGSRSEDVFAADIKNWLKQGGTEVEVTKPVEKVEKKPVKKHVKKHVKKYVEKAKKEREVKKEKTCTSCGDCA